MQSIYFCVIQKGSRKPSKIIEREGGGKMIFPFEAEANKYLANLGDDPNYEVIPIVISI